MVVVHIKSAARVHPEEQHIGIWYSFFKHPHEEFLASRYLRNIFPVSRSHNDNLCIEKTLYIHGAIIMPTE